MERILKSGAVDVIFTFMTSAVVRNQNIKRCEGKLTEYFGNTEWKDLSGPDAFVQQYRKQIEQLGYLNKYKTIPIDVIQEGGRRSCICHSM
jgi:hypothetical protein